MPNVVYYGKELITVADVNRAIWRAGPDAIHVRMADAIWPDGMLVQEVIIPGMRDPQTRLEVLNRLWNIRRELPLWYFHGVDLIETIRYAWFFETERAFYEARVAAYLIEKYAPARLYWIIASTDDLVDANGLRLICQHNHLDLRICRPLRAIHSSLRRLALAVKGRLSAVRNRWRSTKNVQVHNKSPAYSGERPRIIFVDNYPNSAKISLQLAEEIERTFNIEAVFVAGRQKVLDVVNATGRSGYLIEDFTSKKAIDQANIKEEFPREFQRTLAVRPESTFRPPIYSVPCREILMPQLISKGVSAVTTAVRWLEAGAVMLDRLRPAVVVTTTSGSIYGRAMTMLAEARQIPSVLMQHGLYLDHPSFICFSYQRMLVWGECDRRRLSQAGIDQDKIHIVGAPHYDIALRQLHSTTTTVPRSRSGCQFLFLASRAGGSNVTAAAFEWMLHSLIEAVSNVQDGELVIKLHPADHTGIAQRVVGKRSRVRVVQKGDSQQMLLDCDVAIVTSSTTGLEACALNKPLIAYIAPGMPENINYDSYGAAICVTNEVALRQAVCKIQFDIELANNLRAGRQRLIDDMLNGANGDATAKAAAAIVDLISASVFAS